MCPNPCLEDKILDFCRLLRKGGIDVSYSQIVDALQALKVVGLDKENFYQALCCNLVTDRLSLSVFSKIFRLYFSPINTYQEQRTVSSDNLAQFKRQVGSSNNYCGEGNTKGGEASLIMLFMQAIREKNYALLFSLAQLAVKSLGKLGYSELQRIEETVEKAKISIGWYEVVNRLEQDRLKEKVNDYTYNQWLKCLTFTEDKIRELLEEFFIALYGREAIEEIVSNLNIAEKEFYRLNNLEIKEIHVKVRKIAKKLSTKSGRRYKKAKKGKIDLRLTTNEALKKGKTPFSLKFKKRIPNKPELVLLCDSSGSVAIFSEFMLQMVYSLQNRFRSVKSFLFVDTLYEVTNYFQKRDIEEALGLAFAKAVVSITGFSDFGKVFALFAEKHLSEISPKTTLIILGDARNNWRPDGQEFLNEISNNVRKILWFNPQPQEKWDTEDSIMSSYVPYCHQVFECRNLKQLEQVAETIL